MHNPEAKFIKDRGQYEAQCPDCEWFVAALQENHARLQVEFHTASEAAKASRATKRRLQRQKARSAPKS